MSTPAPTPDQPPLALQREQRPGLSLTIVPRQNLREFHITLEPWAGETPSGLMARLQGLLREHAATVVRQEVFGSLSARAEVLGYWKSELREPGWPITWVEGGSWQGGQIAGVHTMAVAGTPVESLVVGNRVVGCVFSDAWARHCMLGDVRPTDPSDPKTSQTQQIFANLEEALIRAGMVLSDVARTWLFLDDILSWYGPFNLVRTEIFTQRNLFAKWVPSSTGIGARNPAGAALVAGAWAIQPTGDALALEEVASPLQCEARCYGSCFSRAFEIRSPDTQRLFVSGTASIEPGGRSVHPGEMRKQVDLTMEVIEAILGARRLGFSDVTRATAYIKRVEDAPRFAEWCADHGLSGFPVVTACSDVCRDELLFELELDAMAPSPVDLDPEGKAHSSQDGEELSNRG